MDEFLVNDDLTAYSGEEIDSLVTQGNGVLDELFAIEDPTDDQIAVAERVSADIDRLLSEKEARAEAAAARAARMSAVRDGRRVEAAVQTDDPGEDDSGDEAPPPPASTRRVVAQATGRPSVPDSTSRVTITAAADVPDLPVGASIPDMRAVTEALIRRLRGFGSPMGMEGGQQQHYAVASFSRGFSDDLTADGRNDQEVFDHAATESRLPGGSLVAAGGWCSPSETLYDLCSPESTDGLISLPEVRATRGGLRVTPGIDFSTIYSGVGFAQTEAQAISGTSKGCYEVTCPTFTDYRLDAMGICIKAPILTNAAYPELVQRVTSGGMVVHQHKVSAALITKMVTAAGAAVTPATVGSTAANALDFIELVIETLRNLYRLPLAQSMEVVFPYWVKSAIRADLAMRGGTDYLNVSDEQINSFFTTRKAAVQWVYNWQALAEGEEGYPASAQALVYPSGTFVKATNDIINLSGVYDAAELDVNRYLGVFYEEGVQLVPRCMKAKLVTVPLCQGGITGSANSTACFTLT